MFFEIMNVSVIRWEIPNHRLLVLVLENDIEMHISDESDENECVHISIEGEPSAWII